MSMVSTKYGRMRIIDSDEIVSRSLVLYGEWAMDELSLLAQIISSNMCVLDVGAFIGTHSLAFSEFVGKKGKVYSFEPRKEIYAILSENLSINDCKNVTALNIGLAEKEKNLDLQSIDLNELVNFGGLSLESDFGTPSSNTYQIHISTIDSLEIEKIDVIKLDVEGMERSVLDGAVETISRDRPIVFCECNSLSAGYEILEFCQTRQYDTYGFLASAYNPSNFNAIQENIFGGAKELALLLIPQEKAAATIGGIVGVTLLPINNLEDLVLPLLHKPQYAYEILAHTTPCSLLGIYYPTPVLAERDGQIANLNQAVTERDEQIASFHQTVDEQDGQITNLNQALVERERRSTDRLAAMVSKLAQEMSERDGQIANLNQAVTECDGQIANLNYAVVERDGQIVSLNQAAAERNGQIANLNQAVTERDRQIASLSQAVAELDIYILKLVNSKSWFITRPLRWTGRIVRGDFIAAMDPFKKALHFNKARNLSSQTDIDLNASQSRGGFVTTSPIKPTHPVAVILPVYRGVEMTKRCILAAMPGILAISDSHIIAINDASPDRGMQEMLEQLSEQWPNIFIVLKNEKNLGFVGTVNRGLAYFQQHDAVLLNSDVIVPQNWLGRLIDEAYSRANIGTVTPFSNNATICSFPNFLQENNQPFNLDVDSIDVVFRHAKLPCVEAPTGIGFCMYIRRACLDDIGYLNEEKFGRGYGEENDLCQRAIKSGWLNIISPNIYAYHEGGVSFSSEKYALIDSAMRVIDAMHPNYHADVQNFIKHDPLKMARVARYIQLLSTTAVPKVLHITHALGGGVGQHVEELAQYFEQSIAHIILVPYGENGEVSVSVGIGQHVDKLIYHIPDEYTGMVELLKTMGISAVHFHHTKGFDPKILDLPHALGVTHLLTAHDFYWLNANPTLTDEKGRYPGFYSETQHNPLYPLPPGLTIANWQERLRPLIGSAECVIFPSNSTKSFFDKIYRIENAVVAPHVETQLATDREPCAFTKKDGYIIGVLGAIGREKGADLLEQIAGKAKKLDLPFKFKLIGYSYRPLKVVETTGPYETKELAGLIQKNELDIVFFSAQWPETYSYTLSHALNSGLPIIAPSIGAFPERLSGRSNTLLFNYLSPVTELLDQFEEFIEKLSKGVPVTAPIFEGDKSKHDFYACDYLPLVSRNLKIIEGNKAVPFGLDPMHIVSGSANNKSAWRELLLRVFWRLYMNRSMQWIGRAIPKKARGAVRRALSTSSIHDIAQGSRGK